MQRDIIVIPKSSSPSRIEANFRLVTLSEADMKTINGAQDVIGRFRLGDTIPGIQFKVDGKDTMLGWSKVDFGWEDESGNWLC